MNSGPFFVLSTLPGCGSPCSSCSAAPRSPIARLRLRNVLLRSSRSASASAGVWSRLATSCLSLRDSIREVRRRDIELPHAGMQPLERIRVVGW